MILLKRGEDLCAFSDVDAAELIELPNGAYEAKLKIQSERSIKYHQRYFAGLLGLALDYWEPTSGLLSPVEEALLNRFAKTVEREGNAPGALTELLESFKAKVREDRSKQIESPVKTIAMLHRWVKEELGYYDIEVTPAGIRKRLKSISFSKMDQAEFEKFYREAFGCIWRLVLSRIYKSEKDLEDAVIVRLEQLA